jgi:5-methylthioadenosine/S-adenosylhomocysteine deaminase
MLLTGGYVLTMDRDIGDIPVGDVLIADGTVIAVGRDLGVSDAHVIDVSGSIVLPGFVDTHRHTWETAIRGSGPDATLDDYNTDVIGTFAPIYRPEDVYASNLGGAIECLNAGITTLVDWSHINHTPDYPDAAIQGLRDAGIRARYAYGPSPRMDYWFNSSLRMPEQDVRRVREAYFSSGQGLLTMGLATRGPRFSVDEVVLADWKLARDLDLPITCHVGHGRYGGRFAMVENLDRLGLLGPDITYVHACLLADEEWRLVRDSGGTVSIAPQVEMQMGHGHPPLRRCLAEGVRPSLSIDVVTSVPGDMFTQMRAIFGTEREAVNLAALRDRQKVQEPMLTARQVLEVATIEGAHVAGLGDWTGSLTPGKRADVIVIDASAPNLAPLHDPVAAVVLGADVSNVSTVVVDGVLKKSYGKLVRPFDGTRRLLEDSRDYLLSQSGAARSDSRLGAPGCDFGRVWWTPVAAKPSANF